MKNIIPYILAETFILAIILIMTKGDLMFHLSKPVQLTAELISKKANLSYDQFYTIHHPMRYRLDIQSKDKQLSAALIWPQPPFGSFLILTPSDDPDLNNQTLYSGRLVRCLYKCLPNDMLIEMFPFVETLEKKFPALKGRYSELPSIILNTYQQPGGLQKYLELTLYYWSFYAFALTVGLLMLLRNLFKKPKKANPSKKST